MATPTVNSIMIPQSKPCHKKLCETTKNKITIIAIGALVGFLVCMGYLIWFVVSKILIQDHPEISSLNHKNKNTTNDGNSMTGQLNNLPFEDNSMVSGDFNADYVKSRQSLYVGVLTLEPHLDTRATACNDTWGQNTKISKLEFYAEIGHEASSSHQTNVVHIKDRASVDAWHTEKSFLMLESICANHIDNFDWFMRTVDDSYVNVENMWDFLDSVDKSQELMLGHPTLPIDDISYTALSGRSYCLGGPGLIFSRPLLKELCPNLKICRTTMTHLPADVAMAKCASETTGVECAFIPEMQKYFVHSFEKNQFHLLNEFVNAKDAFSYHPLKSDWMMKSLHQRIVKQNIEEAIIQLDNLKLQESYTEELVNAVEDLSYMLQNDSPDKKAATEEPQYTTFYTRDGQGLSAESCLPSYDLVNEEIVETNMAEHFAKTSVQWGHFQACHEMLSTYHTLIQDKSFITVDMICTNLSSPGQLTLSRSVMYKTLGPPSLLTQKHWKTSNYVLIVVQASTNDPKFIDFVLSVSELAHVAKSNIVLNVIDLDPYYHGTSQSEMNDENSKYYLDRDFEEWYQSLNIHLNVYKSRVDKPLHVLYGDIMLKLSRSYPHGTVLFTSVNLQFDIDFMLRCRTLVREGIQVYNPLPVTDPFLGDHRFINEHESLSVNENSLDKLVRSIKSRPLCIHIKDFIPERKNNRNRRNKHKRKTEPLNINSAFDSHLRYV